MSNVYKVLKERGFVEQVTDEEKLVKILERKITCYIGFDPTAPTLHLGHLLQIMALSHIQQCGHQPIILLGGATALIGDPSGKTEMRRILSHAQIKHNAESIKEKFSHYIDFDGNKALMLNNEAWLLPLHFIDFLRDIGRHFSVNRMLATESYKMRLETGLNFIEFTYMLLQAYDFLHLYKENNCILQMGGNDQWGNILAGIDLVRRMTGVTVYGLTFPLITTATGAKMGKTEKGALWIDAERTTPYDFYQFWINTDDRDVTKFLALFTFLPMKEIKELCKASGSNLKKAKEVLAFEATKITHGLQEAVKAQKSAKTLFYGEGQEMESLPTTYISKERLKKGIPAFKLFEETRLCSSRGEARRLIRDGGAYINGKRINDFDEKIDKMYLNEGILLIRAGKKRYHRIVTKGAE